MQDATTAGTVDVDVGAERHRDGFDSRAAYGSEAPSRVEEKGTGGGGETATHIFNDVLRRYTRDLRRGPEATTAS